MGENWMPGTVVRIDYAEGGVIHPYQVHLDDGQLVFSPTDTDDDIRVQQQQQQDQPAGMSAPLFFCLLFVCFVNACLFVRQVGRAILFSIGMGMSAAEADLCLKTLDLILNKT